MNQETLQKLIKAGKIAAQVRREGIRKLAVPGTSFKEVMDYCEKRIIELGGEVAWAQMAVNDVAAHYCPEEGDESVSHEGDLIKIDIGVHLDGWLADNAMSVVVGEEKASKENKNEENQLSWDLIKASQNALKAAIRIARPGTTLGELGEAQLKEAEKMGFTTIKNLSGHTLEPYRTHAPPSIPTFNNQDKTKLTEGMVIALEPFVTNGQGMIKEKGKATVFMVEKERGVHSLYARKIMGEVKARKGLPFTLRQLQRKFGKGPAALGLRELQRVEIIKAYPPLAEISGAMIAQTEHSLIITKDKPIVYTRCEEDEW